MGLLDSLFGRRGQAALPPLEALLAARECPADLSGLSELRPEYDHLGSVLEREAWASAVAELHRKGLSLPRPYEDVQEALLPQLVPTFAAEREGGWKRLFIEGLHQRLVLDGHAIPAEWLTLWARNEAEVLDRALDNLRARSHDAAFVRLPSGIYRSPWRDGLDATRLLLPEIWHPLFAGQHPFLAIPNPNTLLVAPQILLPKLVEAVSEALKEGLLQATLLERVGDKLVPARLQEPHPMAGPQKELKQVDLLEALRVQAQDLDPALGLPAPAGLMRTPQGRTLTVATWQEGDQPVLLPEVDLLALITREGRPLGLYVRTTLPRLSELRGEPVPVWGPRRLRYTGFPTATMLEKLDVAADADQMRSLLEGPSRPAEAPRPASAKSPGAAPGLLSTQPVPKLPAHLRGQLGKKD